MPNPLLTLLKKDPEKAKSYHVKQIVGVCGKGSLKDGSECSKEFREYLGIVPTEILLAHANDCLEASFENSGCVLQDVVNELGRRLDYKVEDGLYHGKQNAIGFDGVWSTGSHSLVVEVKTTDAFLTNLDTVEEYRQELTAAKKISKESSILLVVGLQDTGGLEAKVRGSRHAWSMRIISVDALGKLVTLKERTEEDTVAKIHDLLIPFEYTRLDKIIDIAFTAAEDASESDEEIGVDLAGEVTGAQQEHTPDSILKELRRAILNSLMSHEKTAFVKRSRAAYSNPDDTVRLVITLSKRYERGLYWYAYHPHWDNFLSGAKRGFYILGCVGRGDCYVLPFSWIHGRLSELYTTENTRRRYWHVHVEENGSELVMALKTGKKAPLQAFGQPLALSARAG